MSNLADPDSFTARKASFSQASNTSPMPRSHECHRRTARAGIEDGHIVVKLLHEGLCSGIAAAGLLQRPGPGGQIIPARAARGLRARRDDRRRPAAPNRPNRGCSSDCPCAPERRWSRYRACCCPAAAVCQLAGIRAALRRERIDVVSQGQGHHIGLEPFDHRPRLLARSAVALVDDHRIAGLGLPVCGKRLVVVLVQLASGIVGHVQQLDGGGRKRLCSYEAQHESGANQNRSKAGRPESHISCHCPPPAPERHFKSGKECAFAVVRAGLRIFKVPVKTMIQPKYGRSAV